MNLKAYFISFLEMLMKHLIKTVFFQFIRLLGSSIYLVAISFRVLLLSKFNTTFALKSKLYVFIFYS